MALVLSLLLFLLTGGLSLMVVLCGLLLSLRRGFEVNATFDAIVVPGKQLQQGRLTPPFEQRLTTALALWREHPVTIYVSGGNCDASGVTEAGAGFEWLLARGVPERDLAREEQATTSFENLALVAKLLPRGSRAALVSDPCHLPRLCLMAAECGMDVVAVPAASGGTSLRRLLVEAVYIHWYGVARLYRRSISALRSPA